MPEPKPHSLAVLVLHGFSGTLESVKALREPLQALGLPVAMPLLAGHGEHSPEALRGVTWETWLADAEKALLQLSNQALQVIVIGHSMGALLAVQLAYRYPSLVDSLVLAAPALRIASIFAPGRLFHSIAPIVSRLVKNWRLQSEEDRRNAVYGDLHYEWVPTKTVLSFFELVKKTELLLPHITHPALILHCRCDNTVLPESAEIAHSSLGSMPAAKSLVWFDKVGHQLFCATECDRVVQEIVGFVANRLKGDRS